VKPLLLIHFASHVSVCWLPYIKNSPVLCTGNLQPIHRDPLPTVSYTWCAGT